MTGHRPPTQPVPTTVHPVAGPLESATTAPYSAAMSLQQPSTAVPAATNGAARLFFAVRKAFIAYARWLDSISWKRFFLLSVLVIAATGILSTVPPFDLPWGTDRA